MCSLALLVVGVARLGMTVDLRLGDIAAVADETTNLVR